MKRKISSQCFLALFEQLTKAIKCIEEQKLSQILDKRVYKSHLNFKKLQNQQIKLIFSHSKINITLIINKILNKLKYKIALLYFKTNQVYKYKFDSLI